MNLPRMRKRHHPIRLPHEMHFTSVLNWKSIPGQEVIIRQDPINPDRYYTELKQNSQKVGDKTTLTTHWITYATYTEAEEYEKLREEWQEIIDQTLFKVKVKE